MTEERPGELDFARIVIPKEEVEIYSVKIGSIGATRRITLPGELAERLDVEKGDQIHYVLDQKTGKILLTNKPPIELKKEFREEK